MTAFELHRIGAAHTLYLLAAGAATLSWLRWVGAAQAPLNTVVCGLPALAGLVLTFTSQADQQQYVTRLMAAGLFAPILLLFWSMSIDASSLPKNPWAYAVSAAILHAALFVASVLWLGTSTTRVAAADGVPVTSTETLQARLLSLNAIGGPLEASTGPAANEIIVSYRYRSTARSYRVRLELDPATREVRVRERASSDLAKPATASERSLHRVGDPLVDASRPEATSITESIAQVTPVKAQRLAATPAALLGNVVQVPPAFAAELDEEGMLTLLCAVATRSGWEWQPAFFGAE